MISFTVEGKGLRPVVQKFLDSKSTSPARNRRIRVAFLKQGKGQEVARQLGKCHTHSYHDSPSQHGDPYHALSRGY